MRSLSGCSYTIGRQFGLRSACGSGYEFIAPILIQSKGHGKPRVSAESPFGAPRSRGQPQIAPVQPIDRLSQFGRPNPYCPSTSSAAASRAARRPAPRESRAPARGDCRRAHAAAAIASPRPHRPPGCGPRARARAALDEQRDRQDHVGTDGRARPPLHVRADQRMEDGFELAPPAAVREHQFAQRAPVELAGGGRACRSPKCSTTAASPGVPGATTARAESSALITVRRAR